jgi:hypothetical protein
MSWFIQENSLVSVSLGECLCPGTPHKGGDEVHLRGELDLTTGMALIANIAQGDSDNAIERLGRAYLRAGIAAWTFVDESGIPVPVNETNIGRLRWTAGTYALADRAAELYGDALLSPLAQRVSGSSPNGASEDSTSPIRDS